MRCKTILSLNLKQYQNNVYDFYSTLCKLRSNKYQYLHGNNNPLPNGFFMITESQHWNKRALPIFINLMRSSNGKSVNKLSSKISHCLCQVICLCFDIIKYSKRSSTTEYKGSFTAQPMNLAIILLLLVFSDTYNLYEMI